MRAGDGPRPGDGPSGARFDALFDDLAQQAEGLALGDRDTELTEQRRAEYAEVDLAARLFASIGTRLQVTLSAVGVLDGVLRRVGEGWCLLECGERSWVVRLVAVMSLRGVADRVVAPEARPLTGRLGLGSVVRGLAEGRAETVLHRTDGAVLRGVVTRVGADFVELGLADRGPVEVVPFAALAAVSAG